MLSHYKTFNLKKIYYSRSGRGVFDAFKKIEKDDFKYYIGLIDFCAEHLNKDSVVLETGCFKAVSTIIFAHFAKQVYTVDIAFRPEALVQIARCFNVVPIMADSTKVAESLAGMEFDAVYLDSDHSEEHVSREIKTLKPYIKLGGVMAGHDYSDGRPGVIAAVNKAFGKPDKVYGDTTWMKRLK